PLLHSFPTRRSSDLFLHDSVSSQSSAALLLGVVDLMRRKKTALLNAHEPPLGVLDPRHPTIWASITFAVATLTLAWPGLTGRIRSEEHTSELQSPCN